MRLKYSVLTLLLTHSFFTSLNGADVPTPYPAPETGKRLTPPIAETPSVNGAKIYGVRPGSPIDITIPTSGKRPLSFSSTNLPEGLSLDLKTGRLTGKLQEKGNFTLTIEAQNDLGSDKEAITIVVGDTLCLTPPMGWNSWYSFSEAISQEYTLKTAQQMVSSGLAHHGWTYVNIDDCWQGKRGGPSNAIQPNKRFPNMKQLCDQVHDLGLKIGIYSTPWMGTYAGFIGGSSPNDKDDVSTLVIAEKDRLQPDQVFGRYPGTHKQKTDKVGSVWRMNEDAKQWAEWGFDYVKMDWNPNDAPTTIKIKEALDQSGRDIVLSLSNATPFENTPEISKHANLWRTTGDIQNNWMSVKHIGFTQEKWAPMMKQGHWNDPDMLQLGHSATPNQQNTKFRPSNLTPDEQYSHMTLWCMLSAPLLLSCDLGQLDDFTQGLLMNDEVIAVNQDPSAQQTQRKIDKDGYQVWIKKLHNDSVVLAFFNLNDTKGTIEVSMKELGLSDFQRARDLWKRLDIGTIQDKISVELNPHGTTLLKLQSAK